jgi:hypothetical protein
MYPLRSAEAHITESAALAKSCELATQQLSGQRLEINQALDAAECLPYLAGYMDAITYSVMAVGAKKMVCLPSEGVSYEQLARVYLKYVRDRPEVLNRGSRQNLFFAVVLAFPC